MSAHAITAFLSWNWTFWSALVLYSLACIGAGLAMMRVAAGARSIGEIGSPVVLTSVAAALGLGFLGQFWTLLALAGVFRSGIIYSVLAAGMIALVVYSRPFARGLIKEITNARDALQTELLGIRILVLAIMAWFVCTFAALGRPVSGDSMALHMMVPKMAAAAGTLERYWFQPGNEYFGLLGEMTYAALMRIGNDEAAQMSTWAIVLVFFGLLIGICERAGTGLRGKVVALTAFASTTAMLIWIGEGKIDLIASALGLASLYMLIPRPDLAPLPRSHLILAGLLVGFAVTTKLMLGFCLVMASAVMLFWTFAPAPFRTRRPWQGLTLGLLIPLLSAGLIFGAFVLVGVAPHIIKNWILLGWPLAPIATAGIDWLVADRWYDAETVAHIRLLYPFVLTFGEYFAQYGQLSVLVLAFLPLSFFLPRPQSFWRSPLTAITVAAVVAIIGWATFQGDKVVMRYILPVLLLCIPLAAAAAEHVTAPTFRPRLVGFAAIVACFATFYITANFSFGGYFLPAQSARIAFRLAPPCEAKYQWCPPMETVNRLAPPGARVLSISTYKYYLRPDLIQCAYDHRTVIYPQYTPEERWRWLYDQGYSFILPDHVGTPSTVATDLDQAPPWVKVIRHDPNNPHGAI